MTTPPAKRRPQGDKHLFHNDTLTTLFGTNISKMVTRIVVILAAIGTLAIIAIGILHPNTTSSTTAAKSNTSHPPVGLEVGDMAPNFTLSTPDGKKVSLSDYRGRPVMLNFWYSTCPGCRTEIPGIQHYYASQQGFVILGVNVVDDAATASQFVKEHGLTYPVVLDNNQQVMTLYHVNATPMSYFIDRQGIIRSIVNGPVDDNELKQDVAKISS